MWDVAIGRYGEEFIEKRREKLEIWLNRVARHPVISQCAVLDHFLTSGDSEKAKEREREKFIKIPDLLYANLGVEGRKKKSGKGYRCWISVLSRSRIRSQFVARK